MKINGNSIIVAIIKGGQATATFWLFFAFSVVLFQGKYMWVEPNIAILIVEILWFAFSFAGTTFEIFQTVMRARGQNGIKKSL